MQTQTRIDYDGWSQGAVVWEGPLNEVSTPCYVYSEEILRDNARRLLAMLSDQAKVFYALMANDNPEILRILRDENVGLFGGSEYNLRRILAMGIQDRGAVFAPCAFTAEALRMVATEPSLMVFANSLRQYELLLEAVPNARAGMRLNLGKGSSVKVSFPERHYSFVSQRIGVRSEDLKMALSNDRALRDSFIGVHIYPGTNIGSLDYLLQTYEIALSCANQLERVSIVNLGGGLPSTCSVPLDAEFWSGWVSGLSDVRDLFEAERNGLQLHLELGRALVSEAGAFVTTVLDLSESTDPPIIICDGDVSSFPRPFYYEEASNQHPVTVIGKSKNDAVKTWAIAGHTTFSGDLLQLAAPLPEINIGDRLVFWNAGAYCCSMSMRFLGLTSPKELVWTGQTLKDITQ